MANDTDSKTLNVAFLHPRGGGRFDAEIGSATTGTQAIDELRKTNWLPDPGRGAYALALGDVSLDLAQALASQGVTDGSQITVVLTGVAGARGSKP